MVKVNGIEIENERFPNGELKINAEQVVKATQKNDHAHVIVEYVHNNDESIMELFFIVKYIKDIHFSVEVRLHIRYLPYSRMDRQHNRSAFTLKYLTDWINTWGLDGVLIDEPHSDVSPALLSAMSRPVSEILFNKAQEDHGFDVEKDIVFFPDAGAQKRYSNINLPNLVGFKHRDWNTGEIKSLEVCDQVPTEPFKAYIVDDLSSFGGTFLHSAKKLRDLGASEVYLVVAHCENNILKGELINSGLINKIYTTDSTFTGEHELIEVVRVS